MSITSIKSGASQKWLAGIFLAVLVATSFLVNPEPASSSTQVSVPVVIQDDEGNPLSGMTLEVCHQGTGEWQCTKNITSDSSGVATVSASLPSRTGYIQFSAGGFPSIYAQNWQGVQFDKGEANWQPIITLWEADWITVSVEVVDTQNPSRAIENEWVQVSTLMGGGEFSWTMREWQPTDEDGIATFHLDANRWGENPVTAEIGEGGWSAFQAAEAIVDIQGLTGNATISTRGMNYTLSGKVTDENDANMANRDLCLFYTHPSTEKRVEIDFRTDSGGNYSIQNVGNPSFNFEPHACGFPDELLTYDYQNWYNVTVANSTAILDFQFVRTGIEVKVVDENGDPAPFVQLGLEEQSPDFDYRRWAVTNQQGVAFFSALNPETDFQLSYKSQDRPGEFVRYQDKIKPDFVRTGSRNSITPTNLSLDRVGNLDTPVTVRGRVLGVNDSPLANATVQINTNFGFENSNYLGFRLRTDSDGEFSVSGIPYGNVYIEVMAKGYRIVRTPTNIETSEVAGDVYDQGDFRLRPSVPGTLEYSGTLRDSTGKPIPEMELVLNNPFESGRGQTTVETDAQGRFSFRNLNEGHHWLYANSHWEDYEWSNWGFNLTNNRRNVSLVMFERGVTNTGPQASISGRVIEYLDVEGPDSAVPVQGVCVDVYPVEGGTVSVGTVDNSGSWTATGLVEGEDYFIGHPRMCESGQSLEARFDFQNKYERPQQSASILTAKLEGGTPHLWSFMEVSQSGPGSISGRLKDADDYKNLSGVTVNIIRAQGGMVRDPAITDSRGEYEFTNLPAGEYYVNIESTTIGDDEYWESWMSLVVTDEPNRANILLYKKASENAGWGEWVSSVIGQLFDENGDPHGMATIEVYDSAEGYVIGWGNTDNDGNFEISSLPSETPLYLRIIPYWAEIAISIVQFVIDSSSQEDVGNISLVSGKSIVGEVEKIPQGIEVRSIYAELLDPTTGATVSAARVDPETGQYRIGQVPYGSYKIRFTQNSSGMYWSPNAQNSVSMKPVYWNDTEFGTTQIGQATLVTVSNSGIVPAKNVTFSEGSTIAGTIFLDSSNGTIPLTGSRSIWVDLMKKDSNGAWRWHSNSEVSASSKYSFQFVGLAEGAYKIQFNDSRTGSNTLASNFNGGALTLEEAPEISLGATEALQANHLMRIAPPQRSAAAFDLDDLGEARLAELKDQISLAASALPGSEIEVFVGTEFSGEFVSAFANSTPVLLGDWRQVDSRGYISVSIPTSLPAGAHRIATQDARGTVFGWAPITIKGPEVAVASPAATVAKPRTSMSVVEAQPEETEKKAAVSKDAVAAPAATDPSSGDWILPLAGGFLMVLVAGLGFLAFSRRKRIW